jgi:hypothetical protein
MSLLAFVIACGAGAVIGLADRPSGRIGRLVGLACLAAAFVAALVVGPATRLTIGDVTLAGSEYSGLFLACVAGSGLLLGLVALVSGWSGELIPAGLAAFAGLAVALTAADPGVALLAAAAGATTGSLVIAGASRGTALGFSGVAGMPIRNLEDDGRLAEARTVGLVAVGLVVAAIAILRPPWNGLSDGAVFGVAYLGLGLAFAVRSGAVPFHVPAAHLRRTAVPLSPALLLVWIPAGLGILAVGWSATTFGLRADWLNTAALGVQIVAVATLVLGPLAALVHDELEEVAVYSIVADASFVLLAMAARTDAAAEPARLWLLVFVAAKTGLVAWTAAVSRAFGTSDLNRLRGWMRRTPLLGLALVVIVVAAVGWPGSAVYDARATLIRLALPDWLQFLFAASIVLALASCARLLIIGLRSPSEEVRASRSELPRLSAARTSLIEAAVADSTPSVDPLSAGVTAAIETETVVEMMSSVEPAAAPNVDPNGVEPATITASEPLPRQRPARTFAGVWRLNRTPAVSVIVVCGAALAAVMAFGGLGATNASHFGIPLDTAAHATPTRVPTQPPPPTPKPTPAPTFAPRPSGGPSGSVAPTAVPSSSASPPPGSTSAPAQGNTK